MVGIVVVATIVISFKEIKNINFDYEFSYDDVSDISINLTEKVRENEQKNIENSITQLITNSLNERKIYNCDITIYTDISEQGDIFISDINIICPKGYKNDVLEVIKQYGLNATVNEREVNWIGFKAIKRKNV